MSAQVVPNVTIDMMVSYLVSKLHSKSFSWAVDELRSQGYRIDGYAEYTRLGQALLEANARIVSEQYGTSVENETRRYVFNPMIVSTRNYVEALQDYMYQIRGQEEKYPLFRGLKAMEKDLAEDLVREMNAREAKQERSRPEVPQREADVADAPGDGGKPVLVVPLTPEILDDRNTTPSLWRSGHADYTPEIHVLLERALERMYPDYNVQVVPLQTPQERENAGFYNVRPWDTDSQEGKSEELRLRTLCAKVFRFHLENTPIDASPERRALTYGPSPNLQYHMDVIQRAVEQGHTLQLNTNFRSYEISKPGHVRLTPSGEMQVSTGEASWAYLTDGQAGSLSQQAEKFLTPAKPAMIREDSGHFYGNKYAETKHLDIKEIAKLVRKDIKDAVEKGELPNDLKLAVRIKRFSGGQSLDISIQDTGKMNPVNPAYLINEKLPFDKRHSDYHIPYYTKEAVALRAKLESILNQYNHDRSDTMTDYFDVNFYGHADFSLTDKGRREWEEHFAALEKSYTQSLALNPEALKQKVDADIHAAIAKGDLPKGIDYDVVIKREDGKQELLIKMTGAPFNPLNPEHQAEKQQEKFSDKPFLTPQGKAVIVGLGAVAQQYNMPTVDARGLIRNSFPDPKAVKAWENALLESPALAASGAEAARPSQPDQVPPASVYESTKALTDEDLRERVEADIRAAVANGALPQGLECDVAIQRNHGSQLVGIEVAKAPFNPVNKEAIAPKSKGSKEWVSFYTPEGVATLKTLGDIAKPYSDPKNTARLSKYSREVVNAGKEALKQELGMPTTESAKVILASAARAQPSPVAPVKDMSGVVDQLMARVGELEDQHKALVAEVQNITAAVADMRASQPRVMPQDVREQFVRNVQFFAMADNMTKSLPAPAPSAGGRSVLSLGHHRQASSLKSVEAARDSVLADLHGQIAQLSEAYGVTAVQDVIHEALGVDRSERHQEIVETLQVDRGSR